MDQATVTVHIRENEQTVVEVSTKMSTDLPAENLGEILASALNKYWQSGGDPVNCHAVVFFTK